jgi:hypothetical protein
MISTEDLRGLVLYRFTGVQLQIWRTSLNEPVTYGAKHFVDAHSACRIFLVVLSHCKDMSLFHMFSYIIGRAYILFIYDHDLIQVETTTGKSHRMWSSRIAPTSSQMHSGVQDSASLIRLIRATGLMRGISMF